MDFPADLQEQAAAARAAEEQNIDKGIDAWKKLVQSAPKAWPPRRELARAYKTANKLKQYADTLGEGVEKSEWSAESEKVPVIWEMIEAYRQLKLDVKVLQGFNQILTIEPSNIEAVDALAAEYEVKGRWPDLISILRRKAEVVTVTSEKIELHLRVANLYLEKFSNQAEAIKAFETVLEMDVSNDDAISYLKQMYEKRRDWDKLIKLRQREIDALSEPAAKVAALIEMADMASEKLKKAPVSIELWESVLATAPGEPRALVELERLYEREKNYEKLADILDKRVASGAADVDVAALLTKLAQLYGDRVGNQDKATAAWRKLLAVDPQNRRAQDALKKLFIDQKDWKSLEAFFAAQDRYDEFVRVIERQAETEEGASQVQLLIKTATLYRDHMAKPDRAQRAFEKALAADPTNLEAAEALIPLYDDSKDAAKLADVLKVKLGHATDATLRGELMQQIVGLLSGGARSPEGAAEIALQAVTEDPNSDWAFAAAEGLAAQVGNWEALAATYEGALKKLKGAAKLPILAVLAKVYEQQLSQVDTAIDRNQKVLEIDANHAEAIAALGRLYVATGRFEELLAIYDKKLGLSKSVSEKREIRLQLAGLYENEVRDADKAIETYAAILKDLPEDLSSLQALDRLYRATSAWKKLAATIEKELALSSDATAQAELQFRLGDVRQAHLKDEAGGVLAFTAALELNSEHEGAKAALEAYLDNKDLQLDAVAALEPIYDINQDLVHLVACQRIKLAHEKDVGKRVALLLRVGAHEAALNNIDASYKAYSQAVTEDPSSVSARQAIEDLSAIHDRWTNLVDLYSGVLEKSKVAATLERELLTVLAVTYDERLGQSAKAVEYFKRAQEIAPGDASALDALENLYTRTERWTDLIDTLKKKADLVTQPAEREQLQIRIASIAEETLEDLDEAISAWKQVHAENSTNVLALRALDRLFGRKGLDTELADNLQQQLGLATDSEETVKLLSRLGLLREQKLRDTAAAVETYQRLLEIEPGHDETVVALERILPDPKFEAELSALLEPVYRARSDFGRLVQVLEIQVKHATDPRVKIERLSEIATCHEEGLDDPASAYSALSRALADDPMEPDAQHRIERLARVLEKVEGLIELYTGLVDKLQDAELKRALLHRVAQLATIEIGREDLAAKAYLRSIEVSPTDVEAADALIQIYTNAGDYAQLVDAYSRKMDMLQAPDERKQLGFKAAQIYEEVLESPDQAIAVFNRLLEIDDTDVPVLENLERLYLRLERWDDLKHIYSRRAELAQTPGEKKERLYVLGQVYDRELNDPERAIEVYNSVLDIDPDDYEASQALERLYAATERWDDLMAVLERQRELSPSSAEVVAVLARIGALWREKLKAPARAVEAYRNVLDMDPTHEPTLAALETMMARGEEPIAAAQVLQPIYETAGEWESVVRVYEVMVAASSDVRQKQELLGLIAGFQERYLTNFDAGFEAYARAFPLEPTNPDTIAHLDRLAEVTGRWANLAEIIDKEIPNILDSQQQVEMLLRLARICEGEIADADRAIAALKRVLAAESEQKSALSSLDRLFSNSQRWQELADVLRHETRLAETEEEIIGFTFRLAHVQEVALSDLKGAIESYQEILNADPAHAETRAALQRLLHSGAMQEQIAEILEPLYRLGEEWEPLAELYNLELGRVSAREERLVLLRRLADIAENRLYDQVAGFEWMSKVVLEDPGAENAIEDLLRLARVTYQWEGYETTMVQAAEVVAPDDSAATKLNRRRVLLQLASTYESDLANLQNAESVLLQILEDDAQDPDALAFLDRIYESQGNYESLADILRRRIAITDDTRDLVSLNLRLGRLLFDVLGDQENAIAAYNQVLDRESRSTDALEALEQLYMRAERWQDLYSTYEKMVDIAPGDQVLSDCYARMATIAAKVFDSREKGVELWQRVLDLRGPDLEALTNLADLYEVAGEWRELTDILDSQIRVTDDPSVKIPLYKRLGRIWGEQLSRERNALECWQAVLALDPSDIEALKAIAANYRSAGAWEELSDTLRRLIDLGAEIPQDELKELYAQLGDLEGTTLMRVDLAVEAWRAVLSIDPGDFRALAALESLFTQQGRWEETVEVLESRAAALASPDEKVDVLMQAASVWTDKLDDSAAAGEVYARILGIDPANNTASVELEQIYRSRSNWEPLIDLLIGRVEHIAEARAKQEVLVSVARIYERELGSADQAFEVLGVAFEIDFSNDEAALELERLARAAGKWNELITQWTQVAQGEQDPKVAADLWVKIAGWWDSALNNIENAIQTADYALRLDPNNTGAMSALELFYRKRGQWQDLVGTLSKHAEIESEPEKKVGVLLQLADTFEQQMGDAAQAAAHYEKALAVDERCMPAIESLERLYRRMNAWDRLVEVLTKKSHSIDDGDQAVQISLQVGELWQSRLGDNSRAIDAFKEVLSVDSQNIAALDALINLYDVTGQSQAKLDIMEHKLDVLNSDQDRIELYLQMATDWEQRFGQADRAIENLQKVVLIDPQSEHAYRELERLFEREKRWTDLVETLRTHIDVVSDPGERVDLYFRMGQIYQTQIKEVDRAIEAFEALRSFDGQHAEALWALSRLYEEIEDWDRSVDVMQQIVGVVAGPQKVELNYRLGKIYDEQMRMPEEAEERFNAALAFDPAHVPSMLGLINLYKQRGDSLKAGMLMVRAEENTQNTLEKTRLLFDAGQIYLADLGDDEKAADLFARVVALDPDHAEAAEPLSEFYFQHQKWEPLVPLLEMLTRKQDRRPVREMHPLFYRLAMACDKMGLDDKALKHYKRAFEIDATHLPTLMGRADLLFRRQEWDDAFKLYQTILVHHREAQKDEQIVEIFYRIGTIKLKVNERPKAINMFEKALEILPGHKPTLEALVEVYSAASDWEGVVKQKRAILANATAKGEKLALLQQIIDTYRDKLKSPQKAIAAYLEALEIEPESRPMLHKVLELFSETEQWKKAVETTMRLANLETGKIKAKFIEAAGNITRDFLKSPDEAIELYNQALDEDPYNLKLFERIDRICTSKKDFKSQERQYRKMIKRMGQEPPAEHKQTLIALWHALGEIYRSRLKDLKAAIAAFEVCVGLDPDGLNRHQILAELYQMVGPENIGKAVNTYRFIISKTQDLNEFAAHVKVLRKMFSDSGQYDRAWSACGVLMFMRAADAQEQQFYEQYRAKGLAKAKARLTEEMWQRNIYHPDENRYISQIMAAISPALLAIRAQTFKDAGLKHKDRRDISTDPLLFSRVFNYVTQVLAVPPPQDVYLREGVPGDMEFLALKEKQALYPSLIVGGNLLQGRTEKELAFVVGRRVTLLRPDHLSRWQYIVPTTGELKVWVLAVLKGFKPDLQVPPDIEAAIPQYRQALQSFVPPQNMERLQVVVAKMLQNPNDINTSKWVRGVDLTATRAGFLMCNDLDATIRLIQAEPMTVGMAEPAEKIRDLLEYAISEEYLTLREQLGLTIS